ncbi:MAG: BON domain-containing protein [Chthonomonadaceae bacterium]|nr:BON domain-containing protein [Chthonomonadaceae bacterium]
MKMTHNVLALAGIVAGFSLVGCGNTADGAAKDASEAADATVKTTKKAGDAVAKGAVEAGKTVDEATKGTQEVVKEGAKNTSAALTLTPKVKAAILADTELSATGNSIDVDSAENIVHLKGTVTSAALKKKAETVAKKVLTDLNATDKVSNELMVSKM